MRTEWFWAIESQYPRSVGLLSYTISRTRRGAWEKMALEYVGDLAELFQRRRKAGELRAVKVAATWRASR